MRDRASAISMIKKGALVDKTKNQRALARHQNLKLKPYIESEAAGKKRPRFFSQHEALRLNSYS
jgi:hypothetical protein